jgi:acetyl esterase/lipase
MSKMFAAVLSAAALSVLAGCSSMPGNPPEVAEGVRRIGPVINPPETAKLYAPLQPALKAGEANVSRDVAYGPDERNKLDVFAPATGQPAGARPVIVYVHGGGYVAGNKTAPGSPFYDNVMLWAARNQMVGVNVTYRLAPQHKWPAARDDLVAALGWVGSNIARFGGDPKRVYIVAHSAGATHAASLLADPGSMARVRSSGANVAGAALISGVYDLTSFPAAANQTAYFGDDPALIAARSPLPGLRESSIPLLLATAELDPPEFRQQQAAMTAALCAKGRCPATLDQKGHAHMSEVYALGTADLGLSNALLRFMRR